ncbi:thiol:disulfide interchange protein DsbA/DsbL [Motiliproteus sp. SC1-56]|uniref:thiol:disulfide interchange protein DsbA/DsbL n=1 Tax=Motiliproteus sp. SC1-56 TaxID=2799565 RepID=UPI001A8D5DDA|nr:thiol:disulfide interchange protein DsbA/DsbL [Motiliproteus sp. SC1-56]
MLKLLKRMALILVLPGWVLTAQAAQYTEGVHYESLPQPVRTQDPSKVEVVEVFGYWCPHCNNFERYLGPWKAQVPEYVDFKHIPVVFRPNQQEAAKAYYLAKTLGVEEQLHPAMFDQYHRIRRPINTREQLAELFAAFGVSQADFDKAYDSFALNAQMSRGKKKAQEYRISGVPSMVVNGKYLVTAEKAGSQREMLEVVDYLVEKEKGGL